MLIKITALEIKSLQDQSRKSGRRRMNYNFHKQDTDRMNRMLHAMQCGTYVQPHKHENPDKREAFVILTGKVAVVEYDDLGNISDHITLNPNTADHLVEIPTRTWHSLIVLEDNSVVYEVKDGPYSPDDDKQFADWAPKEGDPGCSDFLEKIIQKLHLQ